MLSIRKKDKVVVLQGKDRGKQGEVIRVLSEEGKALVSKINLSKRHARSTQTQPGGIRDIELPVPLSRLMLVCPKCKRATRPKFEFLTDGTKMRACRHCGEMIV